MSTTPNDSWPRIPILVKREDELAWPDDQRVFYVLARDGLHVCRNHEFFRSCAPAPRGPSELAEQKPFLEHSFPRIPRALFEQIVGFFDRIRLLHNSEASVLLAWDRIEKRVRLVVPEQTATVTRYADGYQHPIGLYYYPPVDLPHHWVVFGDVHSHVNLSAYSSSTDVEDEAYSAGLHIVIGRLLQEPPELHVEAVVDRARFKLAVSQVIEGYENRDLDVPEEWLERVSIEAGPSWSSSSASGSWSTTGWSHERTDEELEEQ